MDREQIRREVERLAPWYYAFDLRGVRTDDLPPCDYMGHRVVHFPEVRPGFWSGKRVLDVGCNEGAWTFGVLDHGAAHVDAFDVRAVNIEKARFVAEVQGHTNASFVTGDCDTWFDERPEPYDLIVFPGVLYHLPAPWDTVRTFCGKAREGILVATALYGADDIGYTQYTELDNIAASKDSLDSMMPNNAATVIGEFRRHGFHPTHIYETRMSSFWGGCTIMMKNCARFPDFVPFPREDLPAQFELHLTPDVPERREGRTHPVDVDIAVYNLEPVERRVHASLWILDTDGRREDRPVAEADYTLDARVAEKNDPMSLSQYARLELDLPQQVASLEVALFDARSGAELRRERARVGTRVD